MICQLGPPTFFVIFTSVENKWIDLLKTFHELKKFHNTNKKDIKFDDKNISELIKGYPITCAQYYDH
jgi:hypothetical protein